jgi:2-amino-4-hydroxy-6-hydroxymethyldihydropteridine diphosphokinase
MSDLFVGLGSNLGDRGENLRYALRQLNKIKGMRLKKFSRFHRTNPVGGPVQNNFLNAVAWLETDLSPRQILALLHTVECRRGRVRSVANGPRTLDLDLLWQTGISIESERLSVPHPRMHERRFVLEPLNEIAPRLPLAQGDVTTCLKALTS